MEPDGVWVEALRGPAIPAGPVIQANAEGRGVNRLGTLPPAWGRVLFAGCAAVGPDAGRIVAWRCLESAPSVLRLQEWRDASPDAAFPESAVDFGAALLPHACVAALPTGAPVLAALTSDAQLHLVRLGGGDAAGSHACARAPVPSTPDAVTTVPGPPALRGRGVAVGLAAAGDTVAIAVDGPDGGTLWACSAEATLAACAASFWQLTPSGPSLTTLISSLLSSPTHPPWAAIHGASHPACPPLLAALDAAGELSFWRQGHRRRAGSVRAPHLGDTPGGPALVRVGPGEAEEAAGALVCAGGCVAWVDVRVPARGDGASATVAAWAPLPTGWRVRDAAVMGSRGWMLVERGGAEEGAEGSASAGDVAVVAAGRDAVAAQGAGGAWGAAVLMEDVHPAMGALGRGGVAWMGLGPAAARAVRETGGDAGAFALWCWEEAERAGLPARAALERALESAGEGSDEGDTAGWAGLESRVRAAVERWAEQGGEDAAWLQLARLVAARLAETHGPVALGVAPGGDVALALLRGSGAVSAVTALRVPDARMGAGEDGGEGAEGEVAALAEAARGLLGPCAWAAAAFAAERGGGFGAAAAAAAEGIVGGSGHARRSLADKRAARDHNAARLRLLAVIPRAARAPRVGDAVVALAGRLVGVGKGAGAGLPACPAPALAAWAAAGGAASARASACLRLTQALALCAVAHLLARSPETGVRPRHVAVAADAARRLAVAGVALRGVPQWEDGGGGTSPAAPPLVCHATALAYLAESSGGGGVRAPLPETAAGLGPLGEALVDVLASAGLGMAEGAAQAGAEAWDARVAAFAAAVAATRAAEAGTMPAWAWQEVVGRAVRGAGGAGSGGQHAAPALLLEGACLVGRGGAGAEAALRRLIAAADGRGAAMAGLARAWELLREVCPAAALGGAAAGEPGAAAFLEGLGRAAGEWGLPGVAAATGEAALHALRRGRADWEAPGAGEALAEARAARAAFDAMLSAGRHRDAYALMLEVPDVAAGAGGAGLLRAADLLRDLVGSLLGSGRVGELCALPWAGVRAASGAVGSAGGEGAVVLAAEVRTVLRRAAAAASPHADPHPLHVLWDLCVCQGDWHGAAEAAMQLHAAVGGGGTGRGGGWDEAAAGRALAGAVGCLAALPATQRWVWAPTEGGAPAAAVGLEELRVRLAVARARARATAVGVAVMVGDGETEESAAFRTLLAAGLFKSAAKLLRALHPSGNPPLAPALPKRAGALVAALAAHAARLADAGDGDGDGAREGGRARPSKRPRVDDGASLAVADQAVAQHAAPPAAAGSDVPTAAEAWSLLAAALGEWGPRAGQVTLAARAAASALSAAPHARLPAWLERGPAAGAGPDSPDAGTHACAVARAYAAKGRVEAAAEVLLPAIEGPSSRHLRSMEYAVDWDLVADVRGALLARGYAEGSPGRALCDRVCCAAEAALVRAEEEGAQCRKSAALGSS